jgi:hypothetical protein
MTLGRWVPASAGASVSTTRDAENGQLRGGICVTVTAPARLHCARHRLLTLLVTKSVTPVEEIIVHISLVFVGKLIALEAAFVLARHNGQTLKKVSFHGFTAEFFDKKNERPLKQSPRHGARDRSRAKATTAGATSRSKRRRSKRRR